MAPPIRLTALDGSGSFAAYEFGGGNVGIVVIQEIFGINAGIRAMVDTWANLGYHTIAPDLFWRQEHGVELDADVPEDLKRAFGLFERFDGTNAVADIEASIKLLRSKGCSKVGVIGYCLGGYLAYLCATRTDSDASIGYYGVSIDTKLNEQHGIGKPLLLHIATADGSSPPQRRQQSMRRSMTSATSPSTTMRRTTALPVTVASRASRG